MTQSFLLLLLRKVTIVSVTKERKKKMDDITILYECWCVDVVW